MDIIRVVRAKYIALALGMMTFAGGCGEGEGTTSPSAIADSKAKEDQVRDARTKAFGPKGNATKETALKAKEAAPKP